MVREESVVPNAPTEESLRALLHDRYRVAMQERGFEYHDAPTVIGIWVYPSEAHARAGMGQWIGMLSLGPSGNEPQISINRDNFSFYGAPATTEFGLTETQRREIFWDLVRAEDQATDEALAKQDKLGSSAMREQLDALYEWEETRTQELVSEVRLRYRLTAGQLDAIRKEAREEAWPFPPLEE